MQLNAIENETWRKLKEDEAEQNKAALSKLETERLNLLKENERLKSDLVLQEKYMSDKLAFLEKSKEEMSLKFKDISNEIIKAQNQTFGENQKNTLGLLLKPFQDQLVEFKKKIEESHDDNVKFDEQIKNLFSLNQTLSKEALHLSNALKGNKKIQGNWGEFQLERVLEISGLEKGINYFEQETFRNEQNEMLRPDVIIKLPNDRQVIIDSKVSLNDYVAYVNEDDKTLAREYLKKHISNIKKHIDELSSKEYQKLLKDQTLDYVMIFIPIESAYVEAAQEDLTLYDYAMKKNIAITTPSSLLPLLRTIENLWQIEKRNKNVAEIAEIGGHLYDKLANFVEDMSHIEKAIDVAKKNYDLAMNKLAQGKGNALSLASRLKEKGARVSKNIDLEYDDSDIPQLTERRANDE
ncbi:MAG: DNA recombination protein RmuC [Alphaproteobacteria bacterium]|nr:DNA recombination protein RmuC [Alphaproteobacteria bacterium]